MSNKNFGMEAQSQIKEIENFSMNALHGPYRVDSAAQLYFQRNISSMLIEFSAKAFNRSIFRLLPLANSNGVSEQAIVSDFFSSYLPSYNALKFSAAGSTSVGGLLACYFLARKLQPKIVVESGVFVGGSLHAFRHAVPEAQIWGFDLSFARLHFRDDTINYVENDWKTTELRAASSFDLCFFDDHINHSLRICEAHARGFRHLLFDDAPGVGEIYQYRYPGVPTVPMILADDLEDGVTLEWMWHEKRLHYRHDKAACERARALIDVALPFPDLRSEGGLNAGHKWYVRLKH